MVLFLENYRTIRFGFIFSEIRFGAEAALRILSKDGKMIPLPFSNLATERGVCKLEFVINFLVSVAASVAGSYVSRWLDRRCKGR